MFEHYPFKNDFYTRYGLLKLKHIFLQGNAIPTAPPVPAQIARALEYIAKYGQKK